MDKKKIQLDYLHKIKILKSYDRYYYEKNQPMVDDQKYDEFKKDIINLENKFNFLKSKNSPSIRVGYEPSKNFSKSLHRVPMLSLGYAFYKEFLINFQ